MVSPIINCNLAQTIFENKSPENRIIEFINRYVQCLDEISEVVKPELLPIIEELRHIAPHDLDRPEGYLESESHARGYVWSMFIMRVRKYTTSGKV